MNGVFLHGNAVDHVAHYRRLQQQAENNMHRKRMLSAKSKSAPNSPGLSLIDFTGLLFNFDSENFIFISLVDFYGYKSEYACL